MYILCVSVHNSYVRMYVCNTSTPQIKGNSIATKGIPVLQSDVAQLAILTKCSNELSAHFPVQHLDVALPSVLSTGKCADNLLRHSKNCLFPFDAKPETTALYKTQHIDIDCRFKFRSL